MLTILLLLWLPVVSRASQAVSTADSTGPGTRRGATVRDLIEMTTIAPGDDAGEEDPIVCFSPDQSKAVVVLQKGNLQQNLNDYSLLLWTRSELLAGAPGRRIVTLSSSSVRPAIRHIAWLSDNETILFLGERAGELQQLYSLGVNTGKLEKLTNHPTSVDAYSATPDGKIVVYTAERPVQSIFDQNTLRYGYVVDPAQDYLETVIKGDAGPEGSTPFADQRLFVHTAGSSDVAVALSNKILRKGFAIPYVSPDGTKAVIPMWWDNAPKAWRISFAGSDVFFRYVLVDLKSGEEHALLDSPVDYVGEVAWSHDSKSVVVSNVFLPIDANMEESERRLRRETTFPVEVNVETGAYRKVEPAGSALRLVRWDWTTGALVFRKRETVRSAPDAIYVKDGDHWRKTSDTGERVRDPAEVIEEQGMNTPPSLVVVDPISGRKKLLFRLNPQLDDVAFSKVEALEWATAAGERMKGGLYYPLHYVPGKTYPLVIQTHGFDANLFQPDGPYSSAFAAQPLAALDIMVFQVNEDFSHFGMKELHRGAREFGEVVRYFDAKHLIDPRRVGIVGFSRTGSYVEYAVTHSKTHFAAAVVQDNFEGSYWQYLLVSTFDGANTTYEYEKGGVTPFGKGLSVWSKEDPTLNVQNVRTPLRIITNNPVSTASAWGWFSSLAIMGKPVEMAVLDFDAHELKKPWNRNISLQGNVDWLDFWLNGHEDADPAKADQYKRWRAMRGVRSSAPP